MIKTESKEITAKLDAIYEQDYNSITIATSINIDSASESHTDSLQVLNLDFAHLEIVRMLATRDEWSRSELKGIVSKQGMMLDGVIEYINEAFFNCYDETFIETSYDTIEINQDLSKEIFE